MDDLENQLLSLIGDFFAADSTASVTTQPTFEDFYIWLIKRQEVRNRGKA